MSDVLDSGAALAGVLVARRPVVHLDRRITGVVNAGGRSGPGLEGLSPSAAVAFRWATAPVNAMAGSR